jgi:hypothetical protein
MKTLLVGALLGIVGVTYLPVVPGTAARWGALSSLVGGLLGATTFVPYFVPYLVPYLSRGNVEATDTRTGQVSSGSLQALALARVLSILGIVGLYGTLVAHSARPDAPYFWIDRIVDVAPQHPSAVLVEPGTQLYTRLSENRLPEQFSLRSRATGRIDTTLRPVVRDGKMVAWDAYFRLEHPDLHYHLRASGTWEGRGGRSGYVDWLFHVKTRS